MILSLGCVNKLLAECDENRSFATPIPHCSWAMWSVELKAESEVLFIFVLYNYFRLGINMLTENWIKTIQS